MGSQRAKEGRLGEDKAARLIHTRSQRAGVHRRGLQGGSCPSAQAACEDPLLSHLTAAPGGPCSRQREPGGGAEPSRELSLF